MLCIIIIIIILFFHYFGIFIYSTSHQIKYFCEVASCPDDMHQVNADTCCVHHTGAYVCSPLVRIVMVSSYR